MGWQPWGNVPGIAGLNGYVEFLPEQGQLFLESSNLTATAEGLYTHPLSFNELNGYVSWERQTDGWQVMAPNFLLAADNLMVSSDLNLWLADYEHDSLIDLLVKTELPDVAALEHYYPTQAMPEPVVEWC